VFSPIEQLNGIYEMVPLFRASKNAQVKANTHNQVPLE